MKRITKKNIKKIILYICVITAIFTSIKLLYGIYQCSNLYNEFKKTEIINTNIDISTLKDTYILLDGKINSNSDTFESEYIKATNTFAYLEEDKEHYGNKTGWETDNTYKFYANNIYVLNIPINLKNFYIDNSEGIKNEYIKEPYKKYYDQYLYFNKSSGDRDKRILYKVLLNNDDVLIFSKVKDGKLVPLSNASNSIIFAGIDNYKRLDKYLKDSYKGDIAYLVFICFATAVSGSILFKKKHSRNYNTIF